MPDVETVHTNIAVVQCAGVGLSLEDFGTGSSAPTTLAIIQFTEVKIDHNMISRIDQPRMREAVSLAFESVTQYNATLVAEGERRTTSRHCCWRWGVLIGQGYLFSRAVPMDTLIQIACHDRAIFGDGAQKTSMPMSRFSPSSGELAQTDDFLRLVKPNSVAIQVVGLLFWCVELWLADLSYRYINSCGCDLGAVAAVVFLQTAADDVCEGKSIPMLLWFNGV